MCQRRATGRAHPLPAGPPARRRDSRGRPTTPSSGWASGWWSTARMGFAATVATGTDEAAAAGDPAPSRPHGSSPGPGGGRSSWPTSRAHGWWPGPPRSRHRSGGRPAGRQGGPAGRLERPPARRRIGVDHVTAEVLAVTEDTYYADLSGTEATQRRVRVHPVVEALALDPDGGFETMRTVAPPVGPGLGVPPGRRAGTGTPSWPICRACWPTRSRPRRSRPVRTTWSSTRPTCGSPSTSRSGTPPSSTGPWGTRRPTPGPPSPPSTSSARCATAPASCTSPATGPRPTGWPRWPSTTRACPAQSFDLIRGGILVGYQLDRAIAAVSGLGASNGCAFADSPLHVPIQRMANVSLQPGRRGRARPPRS